MIKLSRVLKVEVGGPGDFTRLSKQGILEKLQERAGPEARRLFEKFMVDVEKLQQEQKGDQLLRFRVDSGHCRCFSYCPTLLLYITFQSLRSRQ